MKRRAACWSSAFVAAMLHARVVVMVNVRVDSVMTAGRDRDQAHDVWPATHL